MNKATNLASNALSPESTDGIEVIESSSKSIDGMLLSGQSTPFTCPVCLDVNLDIADLSGTQVCGCKRCHGFLIDSLSLGALIGSLRAEYRGANAKPILVDTVALSEIMSCPTCFVSMYTHPYYGPGNAVINSCSCCELNWLDAGEMASIIRAPGRRH